MEAIKLGDRITIPGKNVKGEIAFIGKTEFAAGTWYGIILDDPVGKHNGTVEGKCYFNCPRKHGIFIKSSYIEREHVEIKSTPDRRRRSLIPKLINYSNYPKTVFKQKPEASKCKMRSELQNENCAILGGDDMTNTNDKNTESTTITECGDNKNATDEKKVQFVRRYTNYLKASSKLAGSHFCSNKSIDKSDHEAVADDHVEHNSDKNLILPIANSNSNPDKDDNKYPKKIVYPNYLKASSKLVGRNICIANISDMNYDGIKNALEMQASLRCEDNDTSENYDAYLVKYPYHQKTSYLKENYSCSTNRNETLKKISSSKKEDHEIPEDDHVEDIPGENIEIEAMKRENKDLKRKLKSTEISLQEALNKYKEAQEEIKYLKYDKECQRKQIKLQKIQLKLLKMTREKDSQKDDDFGIHKTSKQKKIGEILDNTIKKYGNKDAATSEGKFDLTSSKATVSTQRVLELEEQNSLMKQGLVELRDFLKMQSKSQSVESKPLNFDSDSHLFSNRRKQTCSESFASPPIPNPETCTTEESEAQLREYSEMLRKMRKFNELLKEKREKVKSWEVINLTTEPLENSNLVAKPQLNNFRHPAVQSTQYSPNGSAIDIDIENYVDPLKAEMDLGGFQKSSTFKKSSIQNYQIIDHYSQDFPPITEIKRNINENHVGNGVPFESADCIDELSHPESGLIYYEDFSLSNTTLVEEDVCGKDLPTCLENSSSRELKVLPVFPLDLQYHSTDMTNKSSGNSPITLTKSKRSDSKMPARKWNR